MAEGEISSLKEALFDQYIVMEKLYSELDEERESSATAASEAMSMILRLQREKAAERMEACQYKRMAEEKLRHVEDSLENLKEDMQQKEMEITSLKYRLNACSQKFSSLGVNNLNTEEMTSPLFNKTRCIRRNLSLPILHDQFSHEADVIEEYSPSLPPRQLMSRVDSDYVIKHGRKSKEGEKPGLFDVSAFECRDSGLKQHEEREGTCTESVEESCCESTVGKGELLRTSKDTVNSGKECRTNCWPSTVSSEGLRMKLNGEGASCLSSESKVLECLLESDGLHGPFVEIGPNENTAYSVNVQDIYEVPEAQKGDKLLETFNQASDESIMKAKNLLETGFLPHEATDYSPREGDWLKKALTYFHHESNGSKLRKGSSMNHRKQFSLPMRTASMNYRVTDPPKHEVTEYVTDVGLLKSQLQLLETEDITSQDGAERGKMQLKLLRDIYKQLNVIESNIIKSNVKKRAQKEDPALVSVMEAVLSFSI